MLVWWEKGDVKRRQYTYILPGNPPLGLCDLGLPLVQLHARRILRNGV